MREIWLWVVLIAKTIWMLFLCLIFGLVLLVGLFGCSTPEPPKQIAVNKDCDQVALYARAVAQLRDIGVPLDQTSAYTAEPAVMMFPMQYVRFSVYQVTDSPGTVAQHMYDTCVNQGYTNLLASLNAQERVRQKKLQEEDAMRDPGLQLLMTNSPIVVTPAKKVKHAARRPHPAASQAVVRNRQ